MCGIDVNSRICLCVCALQMGLMWAQFEQRYNTNEYVTAIRINIRPLMAARFTTYFLVIYFIFACCQREYFPSTTKRLSVFWSYFIAFREMQTIFDCGEDAKIASMTTTQTRHCGRFQKKLHWIPQDWNSTLSLLFCL